MEKTENGKFEGLTETDQEYLADLLKQLADDDYLLSFRSSEWLGLAPHIEEDVASASISQDMMGHASMYYGLLGDIYGRDADDLAHFRKPADRRNSILTEKRNGEGEYLDAPKYDWAYHVVRNLYYNMHKKVKLDALKQSSCSPLRDVAAKAAMELYYHELHWRTWFIELMNSNDDAKARMTAALEKVNGECADLFHLGKYAEYITAKGYIAPEAEMKDSFRKEMEKVFSQTASVFSFPDAQKENGRLGGHTRDLEHALELMNEVYGSVPEAKW